MAFNSVEVWADCYWAQCPSDSKQIIEAFNSIYQCTMHICIWFAMQVEKGCNNVKVDTEIHSQNITVSSGPQTHWLAHIMKADLINYKVWKHRNQDILKCRTHHQRQAQYWINIYDLLRASEFFSLKESFSTISRSRIDQTAQPLANHSFPAYLLIELPITCPYTNNISKIITLNFNDLYKKNILHW